MQRIQLDPAAVQNIREAATKSFWVSAGSLAHQEIERLLEQQKLYDGPMYLNSVEMQLLAAQYRAIVRASAAEYAAKLSQAVGNSNGMGKSECDWVKQQARELAQHWISREFGKEWFINSVLSFFTIANEEESTEAFLKGLEFVACDDHLMANAHKQSIISAVSSLFTTGGEEEPGEAFLRGLEFTARHDHLMVDAEAQITLAAAVYGSSRRDPRAGIRLSRVTPGEKLSDPIKCPVMTVPEVQDVTELSRSSVYRKLDDGRLKRAFAGKEPGKRCRCLVKTQSVIDFLQESPE